MSGYSQWLRSHSTGITTTVMYVTLRKPLLGVSTYNYTGYRGSKYEGIDLENNFIIATKVAVLMCKSYRSKNQEDSSSKVIRTIALKPIVFLSII